MNNCCCDFKIVQDENWYLLSDAELEKLCQKVLDEYPKQVQQYKRGKQKLFGFFVRHAIKAADERAFKANIERLLNKLLQ